MAKLNYWERREAQDMYNYMESAEKKADEIAQLYLKASRYISTQADQIFDKYKGKYGLSESEARRLLNELKDKTSLDELLQKLRDGDSNDSCKELKKQLESAAYQASRSCSVTVVFILILPMKPTIVKCIISSREPVPHFHLLIYLRIQLKR